MIGLKFPAYLIPHPNKVLWILHQHRQAYEQWDHPLSDMIYYGNGREVRDAIRRADTALIPEARGGIYQLAKRFASAQAFLWAGFDAALSSAASCGRFLLR